MKTKSINQSELTSECWSVQIWGLEYCETCEFLDTPECGGQEIRRKLINEKGFKVPLKDQKGGKNNGN